MTLKISQKLLLGFSQRKNKYSQHDFCAAHEEIMNSQSQNNKGKPWHVGDSDFGAAEYYGGKERLLSSSTKYFCIRFFVSCTERYFSLSLIFLCVCVCVQHVRYYFPDQGSNTSPALGAQSLNHWTTREVPLSFLSSHYLTFISLHCSPRTPDSILWKWYLGLSDTGICFFLKNTVCISDDNFAGSQSFIIGIKHPQK